MVPQTMLPLKLSRACMCFIICRSYDLNMIVNSQIHKYDFFNILSLICRHLDLPGLTHSGFGLLQPIIIWADNFIMVVQVKFIHEIEQSM